MSGFWKVFSFLCTQYLVGPALAWITASMRRGMEAIILWHCSGVMKAQVALIAAFRSSALLGLVSLIFLLTIPHRFSMGFRSGEFAGQSRTVTPWFWTSFWYFCQCGQVPSLAGKWHQHLHKACQQKEALSALKFPGRCCVDCVFHKTQWTKTSRWHGSPNHHRLWKLHTGLQAIWVLCLSALPPDSGTLISKRNAKFTFIWKEDFGPVSNSPVLFLLSPGKMLLTMFLFQKWLGSPFSKDVWALWLLMHWLQLQFTPCKALPSVWIGFAWLYSQACGHPCCFCTFSYPMSSF